MTYALTVAYALLLNQTERRRWLVDVQLVLDAVIVAAIVYLTGGINSYFSSLYTLPIIAVYVFAQKYIIQGLATTGLK